MTLGTASFRLSGPLRPFQIFRLTSFTVKTVKLRPGLVPTAINKNRADGTVPVRRKGTLFRATFWCSESNIFRIAGTARQSCAWSRDTVLSQRTIGSSLISFSPGATNQTSRWHHRILRSPGVKTGYSASFPLQSTIRKGSRPRTKET